MVGQIVGVFHDEPSSCRFIAFSVDYHIKGTDKSSCQVRSLTLLGVHGLSVCLQSTVHCRKPFHSSLFHSIHVHLTLVLEASRRGISQ